MDRPGSPNHPLRVAIIGAGPAGYYAAGHLLKQKDLTVSIDLYDKLIAPTGLVRNGVAPDHQKIKKVSRVFDKSARDPRVHFFGNVEFGKHISLADLQAHYHAALFSTGTQIDRRLGLPGEDLAGSHSATEFVAWYNGHPDYTHLSFDLSRDTVCVIGVGNVAVDVARILLSTHERLAKTDIADYALEALRKSDVKHVVMLGRRGPAQAAFTNPEIKELCELDNVDVLLSSSEGTADALSIAALEANPSRTTSSKLSILAQHIDKPLSGRPKRLSLRFLISPTAIQGNDQGEVAGLTCVKNVLYQTEQGRLRPRALDHTQTENIPCGLVFRSIGYRGTPLPDLPFHERWGIIPNAKGRVLNPRSNEPIPGLYTAGWIKRGPTGVIGTNKADAVESVVCLLEDIKAGNHFNPEAPAFDAVSQFLSSRQPHLVSYREWTLLDQMERERGEASGRPRVKFTDHSDMLDALPD